MSSYCLTLLVPWEPWHETSAREFLVAFISVAWLTAFKQGTWKCQSAQCLNHSKIHKTHVHFSDLLGKSWYNKTFQDVFTSLGHKQNPMTHLKCSTAQCMEHSCIIHRLIFFSFLLWNTDLKAHLILPIENLLPDQEFTTYHTIACSKMNPSSPLGEANLLNIKYLKYS